jgi:hypothetical protein
MTSVDWLGGGPSGLLLPLRWGDPAPLRTTSSLAQGLGSLSRAGLDDKPLIRGGDSIPPSKSPIGVGDGEADEVVHAPGGGEGEGEPMRLLLLDE